jgi:hypothetical protein
MPHPSFENLSFQFHFLEIYHNPVNLFEVLRGILKTAMLIELSGVPQDIRMKCNTKLGAILK